MISKMTQVIRKLDMRDTVSPQPAERDAVAPSWNRWKDPKFLMIGAVLLLAAVTAIAWWSLRATGSVTYVTAPVTRGDVTRTVTASGTVNPELTVIVGTYVSGVIQQLHCDYNTQVKSGQLCAKIDPRPYQTVVDQNRANLAEARAQLKKDQANLEYAQLVHERNARLVQTNAVSRDAADNAKSLRDQAQAQVELDEAVVAQRQAQLATAEVNLGYTDIVSPVDGIVVSRAVTVGQTVAASFQTPTLFLIATALTRMQVDANVSESDIGEIRDGNVAAFTVDAFPRRSFEGKVTQVRQSPQTVQNVVTYDVVVSTPNPELLLKPGMTAATRIVVQSRAQVLRVPNQALRYIPSGTARASAERPAASGKRAPEQAQVFVLRDGQAVPVPVKPGLDDENFTEIVEGALQPGDRVIVSEQGDGAGRVTMPAFRF